MAQTTKAGQSGHEESPGGGHGECFVIMPISTPDGYGADHFARVYEDLFKPAIKAAGFEPKRADDVFETNLIQLDLLRSLLDAPMAICDLSSRNPNVLFELGLRQAFDKPVVIVQEEGTAPIFDISSLRFTTYRRERIYHQVLEDQRSIRRAIEATRDAAGSSTNVNSLVRLLGLTKPASIPEIASAERDPGLQLIQAELASLRAEVRSLGSTPRMDAGSRRTNATLDRTPEWAHLVYFDLDPGDLSTVRFLTLLDERLPTGIKWGIVDNKYVLQNGYRVYTELNPPIRSALLAAAVDETATEADLRAVPRHKFVGALRPEGAS